MKILKKLIVPTESQHVEITFGIADESDLDKIFKLRHAVYHKHAYFSEEIEPGEHEKDIDAYDRHDTVYVCAYIKDRLLGCMRLVYGPDMPILKYFTIDSQEISGIDISKSFEIGRLVIQRTEQDRQIPKNIVMMMMFLLAAQTAEEQKIPIAFAYIKQKLLGKLSLLRLKVHTFKKFSCVYPRDGKMNRYFYNPSDAPIPAYISLHDARIFCENILSNESLFIRNAENTEYTLRKTLYEKFLRSLGIL